MKNLSPLAFLLAFTLSSCMTFNGKMLRRPETTTPPSTPISLEIKPGQMILQLNGEGTNAGPLSATTVVSAVSESIAGTWKSKGIVSEYGKPGNLKKDPDFTLIVSGVRNEEGSIGMAVLGGLSLMIVPTSSTLVYDLDVELINNRTSVSYKAKAKNSISTVMEILFLPALPFSLIGASSALNDISTHLYAEFQKQGAFGGVVDKSGAKQ